MNTALLKELGINPEKNMKSVIDDLEERQFDYLQRLETVNDETRRNELSLLVEKIDEEINALKAEMKSISSSIIFDFENAAKEETRKGNKRESTAASKVEEIKAKGAERKKKNEEKKQQHQQQVAAGNGAPAVSAPINNTKPQVSELSQALTNYKRRYYKEAFKIFKKLAEENDSTAQFMLGNMYDRGEGVSVSPERAEFWLRKSADADNEDGQLSYAKLKIQQAQSDNSQMPTAIQYLALAADKGNQEAMSIYVELAQKGIGGNAMNKKAAEYCEKLVEITTDSFDKQTYEEIRKDYKKAFKKEREQISKVGLASRLVIIGSLLIMFAVFLLYTYILKANGSNIIEIALLICVPAGYILKTAGDIPEISEPLQYLSKAASITPVVGLIGVAAGASEANTTVFLAIMNFVMWWGLFGIPGKLIGIVVNKVMKWTKN